MDKRQKLILFSGFLLVMTGIFADSLVAVQQKIKIQKENGVEVVYNPKNPEPLDGVPTKLILEEEFTLGQGPDESTFSQLAFFAVDNEGTIYALDSKDSLIKVFNNQGKFLRHFGRKGQGPGEMNIPTGIHFTHSEEIMIEDPMNQRLVYFSPDGKFLRTMTTAKILGLSGLILDSKGNMIGRQIVLADNKMVWEIKKYSSDLTDLYSIDRVNFPNPLEGKFNPFEYVTVYGFDQNDYLYYGKSDKYEIHVFNPEGKLVKKIIKEWAPVRLTEEDKKELLSQFSEAGSGIKDRIAFPEYYPPYQLFSLDEEGRLFVRTYEKGKARGENFFDVFDRQGRYMAKIPLKIIPRLWKNKKLYALEQTEEGYNLLRCFSVEWKI